MKKAIMNLKKGENLSKSSMSKKSRSSSSKKIDNKLEETLNVQILSKEKDKLIDPLKENSNLQIISKTNTYNPDNYRFPPEGIQIGEINNDKSQIFSKNEAMKESENIDFKVLELKNHDSSKLMITVNKIDNAIVSNNIKSSDTDINLHESQDKIDQNIENKKLKKKKSNIEVNKLKRAKLEVSFNDDSFSLSEECLKPRKKKMYLIFFNKYITIF